MCVSCEVVAINGVLCHESGCPDAWRDYSRECKWCGTKFRPEERYQEFCCCCCNADFNGWDCGCESYDGIEGE